MLELGNGQAKLRGISKGGNKVGTVLKFWQAQQHTKGARMLPKALQKYPSEEIADVWDATAILLRNAEGMVTPLWEGT